MTARLITGRVFHDVALAVPEERCHAKAGCGNAIERGPFGNLCGACLAAVLRIVKVQP